MKTGFQKTEVVGTCNLSIIKNKLYCSIYISYILTAESTIYVEDVMGW